VCYLICFINFITLFWNIIMSTCFTYLFSDNQPFFDFPTYTIYYHTIRTQISRFFFSVVIKSIKEINDYLTCCLFMLGDSQNNEACWVAISPESKRKSSKEDIKYKQFCKSKWCCMLCGARNLGKIWLFLQAKENDVIYKFIIDFHKTISLSVSKSWLQLF
jgi:hypothetical protein